MKIKEQDLEELFGIENIVIRNIELEKIGAKKIDFFGFQFSMELVIIELSCGLMLYRENNEPCFINAQLKHYFDSIIREGNTLKIQRFNNLPLIEFSFEPNFSLKLPELWLSNKKQNLRFESDLFDHNFALDKLPTWIWRQ